MSDALRKGLRAWRRRRGSGIPFVPQHEHADCGAACLAMVLGFHGHHVELRELRRELAVGRDGCNALSLLEVAQQHGLRGRGVTVGPDSLHELPRGAILHWQHNHFVVLDRCSTRHVVVVDPALGRRTLDLEGLRRCFTNVAIWLEPDVGFEARAATGGQARAYLARMLREHRIIARVLGASVVARVLALVVPLLTGIVVDRVVPHGDRELLWVVLWAVAFLGTFQLIAQLVRGLFLIELRARVDSDMTLGFLEHMMSLPYDFFQRRQTGDLIMRVGSHGQVREQLTSTGLAAIIDGGFAFAYLAVVAAASPKLAAIVTVLASLQLVALWGSKRRIAELGTRTVEARSRSSARLVQMVAGIEPLKLCGAEHRAIATWTNDYTDELNADVDESRTVLWIDTLVGGLRMLSPALLLSVGTDMVISGELSLGTMLAVNALALGVLGPVSSLVESMMRLENLRGVFDRIHEVMIEPREREGGSVEFGASGGSLELRDVGFSYPGSRTPTLAGVSFTARAGECVALVGPSGSGKSTLARLLVGLATPTQGDILVDGRPLDQHDLRALRRRVGLVPQRPYLFAGTLADNIALAAPGCSRARVRAAAELAGIHAEIEQWPLGYDTMVSEDGGSLSGGQRKRIALARALLADPSILVLDEATSDLDTISEAALTHNLARLHCTRIVIAHRLSTIAAADRVVVLDGGRVVESGSLSELLGAGGLFARLARTQSAADEDRR